MSQPPVGIDLGTTYSALAVINAAGKPEIVPNADGDRITATAVFFEEDGTIIVGSDAISASKAYPDRVARWFKREMGNPDWRFECDGKRWSAVKLSALVLRKLKQDAEKTLGPITRAVITVPAYFDELRRKATMDAAKLAGLEVLRIINEPTSAALAYSSAGGNAGRVLVYDFGGGTFDVSIVDIDRQYHAEVITSEGDHELGGHDLDTRLAEHYDQHFLREKGLSVKAHKPTWHAFLDHAEEDKRSLSKRAKISRHLTWKGHDCRLELQRPEFERLIADEIIRTEMLVDNALENAGNKPQEIVDVLLVGGSTRVPAVLEMLKRKFKKPPVSPINVDEAVALGAAIQAGVIMQEKGLTKLTPAAASVMAATVSKDVATHAYGTFAIEESHGVERKRNSIIIPKDTPLPASRTETYYTTGPNQTMICCAVTQASNNREFDPEFVTVLAEWEMALPPGRRAQCPIKVTFAYDENQRMHCQFVDVESGRQESKSLDISSNKSQPVKTAQPLEDLTSDLSDLLNE